MLKWSEALAIFEKYGDPEIYAEHDEIHVYLGEWASKIQMWRDDARRLEEFGFMVNEDTESFIKYV